MNEFSIVENYLRMNQYSKGISKGDKANLRRKRKSFKFDFSIENLKCMLYFKRVKKGDGDEGCGKICVRTEDAKKDAFSSHQLPCWDCRKYI